MLTDERLQRVVRAYQAFKAEPGFTRVVPMKETLAKERNLSIPLLVGEEAKAQTDAAIETATTALPDTLAGWLKSSAAVRRRSKRFWQPNESATFKLNCNFNVHLQV